jgi:hypothetical protein
MPEVFHLCKEAWRLYEQWSATLDLKAPRLEINDAKRQYIKHRRECPDCSKWLEKLPAANENN